MNEFLIPFSFCALIFGWVYLYLTTRNRERMALIDKGASANLFNTGKSNGGFFGKLATLKLGMFFVGVALGALIGNILVNTTTISEPIAYISMIFFFGGISLVSYYIIATRMKNQE